jgi:hypothetical protein
MRFFGYASERFADSSLRSAAFIYESFVKVAVNSRIEYS